MKNKKVAAAKKAAAEKRDAARAAKDARDAPAERDDEPMEGCFPRGGNERTERTADDVNDDTPKDDFLFSTATPKQGKAERSKTKRKADTDAEQEQKRSKKEKKATKVERASFSRLAVGVAMLGAVKEARQTGLTISLPNQLTGFVRYEEVPHALAAAAAAEIAAVGVGHLSCTGEAEGSSRGGG